MNNLEEFAEEYLENWQDRYQAKDNRPKKEKVKEDLLNYHNPAREYERIEQALNRKLTDEEIDVIYRAFNEEVLKKV